MIQSTPIIPILSSNSISIVQQILTYIIQQFQLQLQINKLKQYLPLFNSHQLHQLNLQCVAYFYLQGQSKSTKISPVQDLMPISISTHNLINSNLKLQLNQNFHQSHTNLNQSNTQFNQSRSQLLQTNHKLIPNKISSQFIQQNHSLNYSMSKSNHNLTSIKNNIQNQYNISRQNIKVKQFNQQASIKNSQQSSLQLNKKQLKSTQLLPLNIKQDPIDPFLQNQLQNVKKNLYMMRRFRKISIQQERQRLDKLSKKKSNLLFFNKNIQHTYQYDGSYLQFKKDIPNQNNQSIVQQIKPNLTRNNSQQDKNSLKKLLNSKKVSMSSSTYNSDDSSTFMNNLQKNQQSNPQRNLTSQQKLQKVSFSNGNKRQVSHLPFIQLKDNTKIIQNKKQLSGSMSLRNSLNRSKISDLSSESNKFRSFAQIQQQKRLQRSRQKALQFTESQSNQFMNVDIMPPTLNLNLNSQPIRKQSKMMQKYLKKLTQQKSRIQKIIQSDRSQKSFNFQQLTVPQKYPIQRYYEYDYEEERQNYEYEISSKMSTKRNSIINQTQCN